MNKNFIKLMALILTVVLISGTTTVFAAEGDIYLSSNSSLKYTSNRVRTDILANNHVRVSPKEFSIEVLGKLFSLESANAAYNRDKNNWKVNLINSITPPQPPVIKDPTDLNTIGSHSGTYTIIKNDSYGPESGEANLNGNLIIKSDATIRNLIVNGTIIINPGSTGVVTLNNVTATNIVIQSGGKDSIHLNDVIATNLTVNDTVNNYVRVEVTGTTDVENTKVESGAKLEVAADSTAKFGEIELAPATKQDIELVGVTEKVTITKPVVVVSATSISTKIESGVEVILKGSESDEGTKVNGTGNPSEIIDLQEVNRVMNCLKDNMFDDVVYPGRGDDTTQPFTLSRMIAEKVNGLTEDNNIKLKVSNYNGTYENDIPTGVGNTIPEGYYEVTLTIAGATSIKRIKVDTVTVNTGKGFRDALTFDIKKVILKGDINISEDIYISKLESIEFNGYTLTINGNVISRVIKNADSFLSELQQFNNWKMEYIQHHLPGVQ